ncbi:alpha/beta hydrolase [Enterococcus sp. AZ109]|uniref:alpha/beta hydrolase n=1 Tax=Enterococcus sp. AZ109 TaxID=2774634 RepID=UPI003F1F453F
MKKFMLAVILVMSLFFFSACQHDDRQAIVSSESKEITDSNATVKKTSTPTLFIHGYSGTVNSFGGMIKRFENQHVAKKELVVTVQPDGILQVAGEISHSENNPIVQVLFADNKNNEWNQTEWIYQVLRYLKEQGVNQVNIVSHSMGGVSSLRYLTTYGEASDATKVAKLIAIGSPFNDFVDTSNEQSLEELSEEGPIQKSSRYVDYEKGLVNVPKNLPILLMAGKLENATMNDGTVPVTSALSIYSLLKVHGNPIEQQVFIGPIAQHSQLHENPAVDQEVADYLWESE